jgi:hypothetical protein
MDNWLNNIVCDVDSLYVEIDNLNNLLVGFYFIKSIDLSRRSYFTLISTIMSLLHCMHFALVGGSWGALVLIKSLHSRCWFIICCLSWFSLQKQ